MTWKGRDVLSVKDFSRGEIEKLWDLAARIEEHPKDFIGILSGPDSPWVTLLFLEPSTRTFHSFNRAATMLGCHVDALPDPTVSSIAKRESTADTALMFAGYNRVLGTPGCMVIRHPKRGGPKYIAEILEEPVINAGDGAHEHPTQALLDCYSIRERLGDVAGKNVLEIGPGQGVLTHQLLKEL